MIKRPFTAGRYMDDDTLICSFDTCDVYAGLSASGPYHYFCVAWSNRHDTTSFAQFFVDDTVNSASEHNLMRRKISPADYDRVIALFQLQGIKL